MSEKIIFIGPRMSIDRHQGGIVILFENLIENLHEQDIDFEIIDSNGENYKNKISMMLMIVFYIFKYKKQHISLHGTAKDYLYIAPFLYIRRKIFGTSYSLRKFAGNFFDYYCNCHKFEKKIIEKCLKNSSVNFFETKYLVNKFGKYNLCTRWFPNVRSTTNVKSIDYEIGSSFKVLFLSQVMKEKGINDLILAVTDLPNVELIIAGRIIDEAINSNMLPNNIRYIGEVESSQVSNIMKNVHVLALPTYYEGEGYPGVIIEAYMHHLPVITTKWKSIPEIAESTAILVDINRPLDIKKAIVTLMSGEHRLYKNKSELASKKFIDKNVTSDFFSYIERK
ncbi:TPA: glycosyltransferase family 4 protein [Photobacterium damselae]